jgi:hypothetical protein
MGPRNSISSPVVVPTRVFWIMMAMILAPGIVLTRADPDLWGHLRFGLDMLSQHTLPSVDPYSFTQDVPWINHEWLSELIMGIAYRLGGSLGLVILKTALVSAALALILTALTPAWPVASAALLVIVATGLAPVVFTLRPQLWTLIGICILCRLFITTPQGWWLAAVPLLFALWVNLHGGWLVGAGLLAVWTTFQLWRPSASRGLILGVAVISALATLANPYGWHMWRFLASTVGMSRPITEWQPLSTNRFTATIPYILMLVVVGLCATVRPRPTFDRIAMIALLGAASLRVARLAPLWVAVAIILVSPSVIAWSRRVPARWWTMHLPSRAAAQVMAIPILCAAIASGIEVSRIGSCVPIEGDWVPDRVVGASLARAATHGTIVTWFNWGEYALWHLSPSLRVSLDGRRETIYSDEVLANHDELYAGTPAGIVYLHRLNPNYIWLPTALTHLREQLSRAGYRVDLETNQSFVAARADAPTIRPFSGQPPIACFPGP